MLGITAPGFEDSSGDTSETSSDNPTNYPSPVPTIKPPSVPSQTTIKYPSYVTKEFTSANPRNMLIEYPSGYTTGATRTMPTTSQVESPDTNQAHTQIYQAKHPMGTNKPAKKTNTDYPSYHIVFIIKTESHMEAMTIDTNNLPHWGT